MSALTGTLTRRLGSPGYYIIGLAALVLAVTPALGVANAEDQQLELRRARAASEVEDARAGLTFALQMPTWLPRGYSLEHIAWFVPDPWLGTTASSVDAWYSDSGSAFIHVWQTDIGDLGEFDPVRQGEPFETPSSEIWSASFEKPGIGSVLTSILSRRLSDGTTISIDSAISVDQLIKTVESLSSDG